MMSSKFQPKRIAHVALIIPLSLALADCAGMSTPAREATEKAAQTTILRDQVAPALRLARASREAGDLASATNLYRTVLAAQPGDGALTVEFGDTLLQAGAYDEAIDTYGRVESISPARLGALLGLARVSLALQQPEKALDYIEQARALAPADARVLVGRGVALDMLGRHQEAQGSYRAVLSASPRDVPARNNLALSLALTGQFPEAVDILTPMAKSTTAPPRLRQNLALIYGLMGDRTRAAELMRVDLDKSATDANLRFFDYARSEIR